MNKNVVGLGKWAVRIAAALAVCNAGAITVTETAEVSGDASGVALSGAPNDTALASIALEGSTAPIAVKRNAIWREAAPGANSEPGSQPDRSYAIGEGIAGQSPGIPVPDFDNQTPSASYRSDSPQQHVADFATWKSTSGAPTNNPEDWLFQMQFSQDSNNQQPETEPFLPVPEPTSGIVLLMGLAGLGARRKCSR